MKILHFKIVIVLIFGIQQLSFSQGKVELDGSVKDENGYEIPYAAVGIPSKYVGTATTEEGRFYLLLSKSNLLDSLEVSSIGYLTYKVQVQDLLKMKEKEIILKEDIVSLEEINLLSSKDYVKNAFKNVKNAAINETHQLNMLYRRFSTEAGQSRFFVEHYIKVLDRGPVASEYSRIEVVQGRKSADYRFMKDKVRGHQVLVTARINPLRMGINQKSYKWKKVGDSSYDGEDLVIIEGIGIKNKWRKLKLYIGVESYGVYKIETSDLDAVWVYRKDANGKLVLSYHNRVWKKSLPIDDMQRKFLKTDKNKVKVSYRHELYILGIETNKKKIDIGNYEGYKKDMGDIDIKYNPNFWNNFSMPPETAFYKKGVKELESIYGVSLETQFKAVNK